MQLFETAWAEAKKIVSAVSFNEAALLYSYARLCPADMHIVEVGAHLGRSTVLLAHTGRDVITIDPLVPGRYPDPSNHHVCTIGEADAEALENNIAPYSNIKWIHAPRESLEKNQEWDVGFMFIDGNHIFPHPKNDWLHFEDMMPEGTHAAFHDWKTFKGVTDSIDELEEMGKAQLVATVESMAVVRKL